MTGFVKGWWRCWGGSGGFEVCFWCYLRVREAPCAPCGSAEISAMPVSSKESDHEVDSEVDSEVGSEIEGQGNGWNLHNFEIKHSTASYPPIYA
jgi:hypothetical protein